MKINHHEKQTSIDQWQKKESRDVIWTIIIHLKLFCHHDCLVPGQISFSAFRATGFAPSLVKKDSHEVVTRCDSSHGCQNGTLDTSFHAAMRCHEKGLGNEARKRPFWLQAGHRGLPTITWIISQCKSANLNWIEWMSIKWGQAPYTRCVNVGHSSNGRSQSWWAFRRVVYSSGMLMPSIDYFASNARSNLVLAHLRSVSDQSPEWFWL